MRFSAHSSASYITLQVPGRKSCRVLEVQAFPLWHIRRSILLLMWIELRKGIYESLLKLHFKLAHKLWISCSLKYCDRLPIRRLTLLCNSWWSTRRPFLGNEYTETPLLRKHNRGWIVETHAAHPSLRKHLDDNHELRVDKLSDDEKSS
jgi:hypothetical protein